MRRLDGECWRFTGAVNRKGYGLFGVHSKNRIVHRVAYELWRGPVPAGAHLDHLCRIRDCFNPAHLEPVSPKENIRRSIAAVGHPNSGKTVCPKGHPYNADNTILHKMSDGRTWRQCRACKRASDRRRRKVA